MIEDEFDQYSETEEQIDSLSEYYSQVTGRNILMGFDNDLEEVYINSSRTNGNEYFESVDDAERRIKQLYSDLILDDEDDYDSLEGF